MFNLFKIAIRNLLRYRRRTMMTASLVTMGVVFVLVFVSVAGSFKDMMVREITDSFMGHVQVHKKGYVASIDNLPLSMGLKHKAFEKVEQAIQGMPEIEAYSPRLKFGAMFSTFVETTNIRLNGVYPDKEASTAPMLFSRIVKGEQVIERGKIVLPELVANGMKVGINDTVVVVATNKDGSVNGKQFIVSGIMQSATGPGGRDGYIHIEDAMEVLRMENALEVSEIAIRLKDSGSMHAVAQKLNSVLSGELNAKGKPMFEVHTWEKLSPFYNIARMIDLMTLFIKLALIGIVLISIMNVMIMAVYERIREIGTIAAIGTQPSKILYMFILEGFSLGILGALIGNALGGAIIYVLNVSQISFDFGRQKGLILTPTIGLSEMLTISAIVIAVSVLASLQPAYKASKMEPIDALRHV